MICIYGRENPLAAQGLVVLPLPRFILENPRRPVVVFVIAPRVYTLMQQIYHYQCLPCLDICGGKLQRRWWGISSVVPPLRAATRRG